MPNNYSNRFRFRRALFIAPLIAIALAGTQANAQHLISKGPPPEDPLVLEGEWDAGPNHFFINSSENVELIRFKQPHKMEMCAKGPHAEGGSSDRGYPISIKWNDQTATIAPGECMHLDAAAVTVQSASTVPQSVILEGTLTIKR